MMFDCCLDGCPFFASTSFSSSYRMKNYYCLMMMMMKMKWTKKCMNMKKLKNNVMKKENEKEKNVKKGWNF